MILGISTCLRSRVNRVELSSMHPSKFACLRTMLYRVSWKLRGLQVQAGARLRIHGKLNLEGNGQFVLGDGVIIYGQTDLFTHSPNAVLKIGNDTTLMGTRIGCAMSIEIGNDCVLIETRVMDTDFHSLSKKRNQRFARVETKPVKIGNQVIVERGSAILKGVTLSDRTQIAVGSVVTRSI
jgi:acetyltransferase-like isoleucine patch superfamily enzyme